MIFELKRDGASRKKIKEQKKKKSQIKYGVDEVSEKPNMVSFVHAHCYCKLVSRVDTGTMRTEYAINTLHFLLHRHCVGIAIFCVQQTHMNEGKKERKKK